MEPNKGRVFLKQLRQPGRELGALGTADGGERKGGCKPGKRRDGWMMGHGLHLGPKFRASQVNAGKGYTGRGVELGVGRVGELGVRGAWPEAGKGRREARTKRPLLA